MLANKLSTQVQFLVPVLPIEQMHVNFILGNLPVISEDFLFKIISTVITR